MKDKFNSLKEFIRRLPVIYIAIVAIIIVYGVTVIISLSTEVRGSLPVISVPSETLVTSVDHTEPDLLKGVKVTDKEDGDISSKAFVENISEFDENQERTITYAVFDSDDQISYAHRKMKYTDYEGPRMYLRRPLLTYGPEFDNVVHKYIRVYSKLDGDISSQALMTDTEDKNNNHYLIFKVKDSCGGEQELKLKADMVKTPPNIFIELTDYLIYVKKGAEIDPMDYVKNIQLMGVDYEDGYDLIKISTNYNPEKEGIYEFFYTIKEKNGDYGITKLVVVVE